MSAERFTLDTNILFYYVDFGAGPRHHRAIEVVERAVDLDCWLTLQSVSEFYAAVTRKGLVAPARAASLANDWLDAFPSATPSVSTMRAALVTVAAGRASWWDALLVATAAEAGCTTILTEDLSDGGSLHGVRVLNPFAGRDISPEVRILLDGD
jgi:predicted nucleic acid-binding protein